jgi:putative transposase
MLQAGARYHVTARANRKEMILEHRRMKDLFLAVVRRAKDKYDFRIENFCIMGNHFHFIIQPGKGANLSDIMRWIMSVFAMAFNRFHHLTGHVWGDRFFSKIIHTFGEFIRVFEYIDNNPVEAHQVNEPFQWEFGGLYHARTGRQDILGDVSSWIRTIFPNFSLSLLTAPKHTKS